MSDLDATARMAALAARRATSSDTLAPEAKYRGAPELIAVRNPTMWVAIAATVGWVGGVVVFAVGNRLVGVIMAAVGIYLGFTVLHESVHRVAHRNSMLNDVLGRPFAWLLWFTYPMFRTCHLRHHANTNDEENDPDHWVSRGNMVTRPFFLVTTSSRYWTLARRHRWLPNSQLRAQGLMFAVHGAVVVALIATGRVDLLAITHLPTLLAGTALFYLFDYLPHQPFDSTERFHDTRVQPGRIRHALLLGQNYHLIHHLWVSIPWFRYRQVFEELEPELRRRGARIE